MKNRELLKIQKDPNIEISINKVNDLLIRSKEVIEKIEKFNEPQNTINPQIEKEKGLLNETSEENPLLQKLLKQDRILQWIQWCILIESLEKECIQNLNTNITGSVENFSRLVEVCTKLQPSKCTNLKDRAQKSFEKLHENITKHIVKNLENSMENLNYPQCVVDDHIPIGKLNGDFESEKKTFQLNFFLLFEIKRFLGNTKDFNIDSPDPNEILLNPLEKRFRFHFYGKKKTNRPERPEWYLQQIKIWMKNSLQFYEKCIFADEKRPQLFLSHAHHFVYCHGLFKLASEKLKIDLEILQQDDVLLSHAIDEILVFCKNAADLGFSDEILSEDIPISVLTQPHIFKRWLDIERKYAFERIDAILCGEECWQQCPARPEVFQCVETFLTMITTLTARFKLIPYSEVHLDFLELQNDLFEDFRMRLVRLIKTENTLPINDRYAMALNSAKYIVEIVDEWQELPIYLHLSYLLNGESTGALTDVIDGFNFVIKDSAKHLSQLIGYEFKARSLSYRQLVNWSNYQLTIDDMPCSQSLGMFQTLILNLNLCHQKLNQEIVDQVLKGVSYETSEHFIEIITENQFNEDGIKQLKCDINRGLIPLLKQFSTNHELVIPLVLLDVIQVLQMNIGQATLLKESLTNCDGRNLIEAKEILKEMNLISISGGRLVLNVLKSRTDLINYE